MSQTNVPENEIHRFVLSHTNVCKEIRNTLVRTFNANPESNHNVFIDLQILDKCPIQAQLYNCIQQNIIYNTIKSEASRCFSIGGSHRFNRVTDINVLLVAYSQEAYEKERLMEKFRRTGELDISY